MSLMKLNHALLATAIATGLLLGGSPAIAYAAPQSKSAKNDRYPNVTRKAPSGKDAQLSSKNDRSVSGVFDSYKDPAKRDANLAIIDRVLADPESTAYDKSSVAHVGAILANEAGDKQRTLAYFTKALENNSLDNNAHYDVMYNRAIMQMQLKDSAGAIATLEQFFKETGAALPEQRILLAQAYYDSGKFAEAATNAKMAIDAKPGGDPNWQQLYLHAMKNGGNSAGALDLAATRATNNPNDKAAQLDYIVLLLEAKRDKDALEVMKKMRANKLLTSDADYRRLFVELTQFEGSEKDVIDVINEGLASGALTQDFQVNLALAQSYFFTGQETKAIEFYEKAGPESKNGEALLNLARIYWQRGENVKAKETARKAQAKGVKDTKTVTNILALPDKGGAKVILNTKK